MSSIDLSLPEKMGESSLLEVVVVVAVVLVVVVVVVVGI